MAPRRVIHRDRRGRFARAPLPKPLPDPLNHPTDDHPRWRLRVFRQAYPWRASKAEAVAEAIETGNARRDSRYGRVFLDPGVQIDRDPDYLASRWTSTCN